MQTRFLYRNALRPPHPFRKKQPPPERPPKYKANTASAGKLLFYCLPSSSACLRCPQKAASSSRINPNIRLSRCLCRIIRTVRIFSDFPSLPPFYCMPRPGLLPLFGHLPQKDLFRIPFSQKSRTKAGWPCRAENKAVPAIA